MKVTVEYRNSSGVLTSSTIDKAGDMYWREGIFFVAANESSPTNSHRATVFAIRQEELIRAYEVDKVTNS